VAELLVDTDVFVDHLRGARRLPDRGTICYSVITRAELFAGHDAQEAVVDTLLAPFGELPVERSIAERAGRLRRDYGMRMPDALIAATALEHGLSLMTRNKKDFQGIRGLKLIGPKA